MKTLIASKKNTQSFLGAPKATPKPPAKVSVFNTKKPRGFAAGTKAASVPVRPVTMQRLTGAPDVVRLERQKRTRRELMIKHGLV